jgi:hypothetical protein
MLQLKEDWERKLGAMIRRRAMDVEAILVAAALITGRPGEAPSPTRTAGVGGEGPEASAPRLVRAGARATRRRR